MMSDIMLCVFQGRFHPELLALSEFLMQTFCDVKGPERELRIISANFSVKKSSLLLESDTLNL